MPSRVAQRSKRRVHLIQSRRVRQLELPVNLRKRQFRRCASSFCPPARRSSRITRPAWLPPRRAGHQFHSAFRGTCAWKIPSNRRLHEPSAVFDCIPERTCDQLTAVCKGSAFARFMVPSRASTGKYDHRREGSLLIRHIGDQKVTLSCFVSLGFHLEVEFNRIIGCPDQILLCPEIFFCCLNRGMTEQHLDLLQFSAGGSAELGTGSP